jgi:hypothetical protein
MSEKKSKSSPKKRIIAFNNKYLFDKNNEFGKDLMIAFASANIPVYKLENKI